MTVSAVSAPQRASWEHFPHSADVGVRGFGATVEEAFAQGALALTAIVTAAEIAENETVQVKCQAPDLDLLFAEWLKLIIYEMSVRRMLFARFAVRIRGNHLTGTMWGEPIGIGRHAPVCEPKGATYTALKVAQDATGMWSAACAVAM